MQLIIRFFTKNGPLVTWLVLAIFCLVLLSQSNPYHRSVWFGGANAVTGEVYEMVDGFAGYFNLRTVNMQLNERLAEAREENLRLKHQIQSMADFTRVISEPKPYTYLVAHVVNNSITQAENYLVINKGSEDSIRVGMAVVDQNGVVGKVSQVSGHYAQVISVLNPKLQLSACLSNSNAAGTLKWEGDSPEYARIDDLPRNIEFQMGDTVITTGFGGSFPRGIPIGCIESNLQAEDNNFLSFKVRLFTQFGCINDVQVILNNDPCPF